MIQMKHTAKFVCAVHVATERNQRFRFHSLHTSRSNAERERFVFLNKQKCSTFSIVSSLSFKRLPILIMDGWAAVRNNGLND